MKPTPTTLRFERACRKWQITLGLMDWTFTFRTDKQDGSRYADVSYDCDSRQATITAYTDTLTSARAERIALHEMFHVLLADVLRAAAARGDDGHKDVRLEEHRVIERLLNAIEGRP